jgi:hypothetical protein
MNWRDFVPTKDDPAAANPATIAHFALDFERLPL